MLSASTRDDEFDLASTGNAKFRYLAGAVDEMVVDDLNRRLTGEGVCHFVTFL